MREQQLLFAHWPFSRSCEYLTRQCRCRGNAVLEVVAATALIMMKPREVNLETAAGAATETIDTDSGTEVDELLISGVPEQTAQMARLRWPVIRKRQP